MNKKKNNKTAAMILASGTGERFGGYIPKQYKKILNNTVIEITLKSFINNNRINSIYVVYNKIHKKYIDPLKKKYSQLFFIEGDNNRQKSSLRGLNFIYKKKYYHHILIHDAVRPFVTNNIINNLFNGLKHAEGIVPVLKIYDSIKFIKNKSIIKSLDRKNLFFSQTPQAFSLNKLKIAYDLLGKEDLKNYTDDAQIFTAAGFNVSVINGCENNFKITTLDDFKKAENMLLGNEQTEVKVGQGIDFHSFTEGNKIILFGIKIPFSKSIEAHSDGDIAVHALIDSILGTLSAGDIGTHFPDTNKKYKNINSLKMLEQIIKLLNKNNGKITHLDNTIICEKPKLQKYILKMRKNISKILNIKIDSISIKATTTEKMGFIGRGEGIAVFSTATVKYLK